MKTAIKQLFLALKEDLADLLTEKEMKMESQELLEIIKENLDTIQKIDEESNRDNLKIDPNRSEKIVEKIDELEKFEVILQKYEEKLERLKDRFNNKNNDIKFKNLAKLLVYFDNTDLQIEIIEIFGKYKCINTENLPDIGIDLLFEDFTRKIGDLSIDELEAIYQEVEGLLQTRFQDKSQNKAITIENFEDYLNIWGENTQPRGHYSRSKQDKNKLNSTFHIVYYQNNSEDKSKTNEENSENPEESQDTKSAELELSQAELNRLCGIIGKILINSTSKEEYDENEGKIISTEIITIGEENPFKPYTPNHSDSTKTEINYQREKIDHTAIHNGLLHDIVKVLQVLQSEYNLEILQINFHLDNRTTRTDLAILLPIVDKQGKTRQICIVMEIKTSGNGKTIRNAIGQVLEYCLSLSKSGQIEAEIVAPLIILGENVQTDGKIDNEIQQIAVLNDPESNQARVLSGLIHLKPQDNLSEIIETYLKKLKIVGVPARVFPRFLKPLPVFAKSIDENTKEMKQVEVAEKKEVKMLKEEDLIDQSIEELVEKSKEPEFWHVLAELDRDRDPYFVIFTALTSLLYLIERERYINPKECESIYKILDTIGFGKNIFKKETPIYLNILKKIVKRIKPNFDKFLGDQENVNNYLSAYCEAIMQKLPEMMLSVVIASSTRYNLPMYVKFPKDIEIKLDIPHILADINLTSEAITNVSYGDADTNAGIIIQSFEKAKEIYLSIFNLPEAEFDQLYRNQDEANSQIRYDVYEKIGLDKKYDAFILKCVQLFPNKKITKIEDLKTLKCSNEAKELIIIHDSFIRYTAAKTHNITGTSRYEYYKVTLSQKIEYMARFFLAIVQNGETLITKEELIPKDSLNEQVVIMTKKFKTSENFLKILRSHLTEKNTRSNGFSTSKPLKTLYIKEWEILIESMKKDMEERPEQYTLQIQ